MNVLYCHGCMAERCLRWLIMTSVIKVMQSVRVLLTTSADAAVGLYFNYLSEHVLYIYQHCPVIMAMVTQSNAL